MELDFFKAEHAVLFDLRETLMSLLEGAPDPVRASKIRQDMNRVLVNHLAKEDEHLYPALKRDPRAAATATRFEQEMGGLAVAWRGFMSDWPQERIAEEWSGFCVAARLVLDALADRARREEDELYPLLVKRWSGAA